MKLTKIVLLVVLGVSLIFIGCTKEKAAEAPKEESVAKPLVEGHGRQWGQWGQIFRGVMGSNLYS